MSYLLALVAFAAIFAVYSTVVTVIVEGLHRLFGLRSAGMAEMLRAFYDSSLANLQPDNIATELKATPVDTSAVPVVGKTAASPEARAFADRVSGRIPSESLRWWYLRRWLGWIVNSKQARLTTLQFVERLAKTKEGAALAGHGRGRLGTALTAAGYEFERLGEAQAEYFRARAKIFAVLAGVIVAFIVNIDSITLFRELARNNEVSSRLTLMGDNAQFAALQIAADRTAAAQNNPNAATNPDPLDVQAAQVAVANLFSTAADVKSLGIPVGRGMFPYCDGFEILQQREDIQQRQATAAPVPVTTEATAPTPETTPPDAEQAAPTETTPALSLPPAANSAPTAAADPTAPKNYRDERCARLTENAENHFWFDGFTRFHERRTLDRAIADGETGEPVDASFAETTGDWFVYTTKRLGVIGGEPQPFLMWLIGVLISGGLLGLGAPFWFNLFARAASVAAPVARATLTGAASTNAENAKPVAPRKKSVRNTAATEPEELEKGFLISLGGAATLLAASDDETPPPGREFGERPRS